MMGAPPLRLVGAQPVPGDQRLQIQDAADGAHLVEAGEQHALVGRPRPVVGDAALHLLDGLAMRTIPLAPVHAGDRQHAVRFDVHRDHRGDVLDAARGTEKPEQIPGRGAVGGGPNRSRSLGDRDEIAHGPPRDVGTAGGEREQFVEQTMGDEGAVGERDDLGRAPRIVEHFPRCAEGEVARIGRGPAHDGERSRDVGGSDLIDRRGRHCVRFQGDMVTLPDSRATCAERSGTMGKVDDWLVCAKTVRAFTQLWHEDPVWILRAVPVGMEDQLVPVALFDEEHGARNYEQAVRLPEDERGIVINGHGRSYKIGSLLFGSRAANLAIVPCPFDLEGVESLPRNPSMGMGGDRRSSEVAVDVPHDRLPERESMRLGGTPRAPHPIGRRLLDFIADLGPCERLNNIRLDANGRVDACDTSLLRKFIDDGVFKGEVADPEAAALDPRSGLSLRAALAEGGEALVRERLGLPRRAWDFGDPHSEAACDGCAAEREHPGEQSAAHTCIPLRCGLRLALDVDDVVDPSDPRIVGQPPVLASREVLLAMSGPLGALSALETMRKEAQAGNVETAAFGAAFEAHGKRETPPTTRANSRMSLGDATCMVGLLALGDREKTTPAQRAMFADQVVDVLEGVARAVDADMEEPLVAAVERFVKELRSGVGGWKINAKMWRRLHDEAHVEIARLRAASVTPQAIEMVHLDEGAWCARLPGMETRDVDGEIARRKLVAWCLEIMVARVRRGQPCEADALFTLAKAQRHEPASPSSRTLYIARPVSLSDVVLAVLRRTMEPWDLESLAYHLRNTIRHEHRLSEPNDADINKALVALEMRGDVRSTEAEDGAPPLRFTGGVPGSIVPRESLAEAFATQRTPEEPQTAEQALAGPPPER